MPNLFDLTNKGQYLFCYTDTHQVYLVFKPEDEEELVITATDKKFNITWTSPIVGSAAFYLPGNAVQWFKPKTVGESIYFPGLLTVGGEIKHFSLNPQNSTTNLTTFNTVKVDLLSDPTEKVECMKGVKITHGLQKHSVYYYVGIHVDELGDEHPVYGELSLESGQHTRLYYLYSDLGEIVPNSLSLDLEGGLVYLVGTVGDKPYIETMLLRRSNGESK